MAERQKYKPPLGIKDWENPRKVALFIVEALQGGIPIISGEPFSGKGKVVLDDDTTKWNLRYHEVSPDSE